MSLFRFTICVLLIPMFLTISEAASVIERIDAVSPKLDRKFFIHFLNKKYIQEAYALAQKEDFELGEELLITSEMLKFTNKKRVFWRRRVEKIKNVLLEMQEIEESILKMKGEQKAEALQHWRYVFLTRMVDYVRYINSLKPRFKLAFNVQTQYDSNVNRVPEALGLPLDPSGKSDWQQTYLVNFIWKPFVNNKSFNKDWKFSQTTNAIRVSQVQHEENEVSIIDTESKITRKLKVFFSSTDLAYRLQHFSLSGDKTSRNVESLYLTHRFKVGANSRAVALNWGRIHKTSTKFSTSWMMKDHFPDSKNGSDADDWRIEIGQDFKYQAGRRVFDFGVDLEYSNYSTSNNASGEYDYIKLKLDHKHKHRFSFSKYSFSFTEGFNYRMKEWDNYAGSKKEEDLFGFSLKVATSVTKKLKATLDVKQNWKDDEQAGQASTDADQFQIALGLNWSMP